ncbi:MAG: hypothetical protein N3I35_12485 [Clostridia bacterium]|nr:hypothetical protein [Clostridia bacterium]
MDTQSSIIIGVISGIITAVILYLITSLFKNVFIPWIQSIIYTGIDINDEWISKEHCDLNNSFRFCQDIKLELQQKANRVVGVATLILKDRDKDLFVEKLKTFSVTGIIQDRFVLLTLKHNNTKRIGFQSMLLEVIGEGKTMKGCLVFYSTNMYDISSCDIEFIRGVYFKNKSENDLIFENNLNEKKYIYIDVDNLKNQVSEETTRINVE